MAPLTVRNYASLDINTSSSSFTPSLPTTSTDGDPLQQSSLESSVAPSTRSSIHKTRNAARRSLSLLGRIPKDFSSLIHSHNASTRRQKTFAETGQAVVLPFAGNADIPPFPGNSRPSIDMVSPSAEDERPSRKTRPSNRLYNFLTRSRSRSRSKADSSPSIDKSALPSLPHNGNVLQDGSGRTNACPPSPGVRPTTRVQSRPLSSTTTATNTTITPATPRAKKHPPSSIPVRSPVMKADFRPPTPPTPKHSSTRQKIHTLLGIPLANSRKSSLGSRPTSPGPVVNGHDLPPLPNESDQSASKGHRALPSKPQISHIDPASQSSSPPPRLPPKDKTSTSTATNNTSSSTSTSASSRLDQFLRSPKFFSARSATLPAKNPKSQPSVASASVSSPVKRAQSHRHRPEGSNPSLPTSTTPTRGEPQSAGLLPPPIIIHTPASPIRPGTSPAAGLKDKNPSDPGQPRGFVSRMDAVEEGKPVSNKSTSLLPRAGTALSKGRDQERESASTRRGGHIGDKRSTKHGSFDFERPSWSGSIMRSGSGGTAATGTSATHSRSGESAGIVRESVAAGPGMAGVGTLQRDISLKRVSEEEEKAKLKAQERRKTRKHQSLQTPSQAVPQLDPVNASTSTSRTEGTGRSSSWGRATGKRGIFGSGTSRLTGLTHGPFSFEPPVPSPTFSTSSTGTREQDLSRSSSIRERERLREEKERQREREREKKLQRGDRAPVPVPAAPSPIPSNVGHRSGLKGRSLDLGLGLAWAPTKVREEALLPSSTFFVRSLSGSSSLGGGTNSTGHGRSGSGSGSKRGHTLPDEIPELDEADRSKVGKEVAEVFRNALDGEGYAAFKRYVHSFDAHEIPFDGPTGIVTHVEKLLETAPNLGDDGKRHLLDNFIRIILQNT